MTSTVAFVRTLGLSRGVTGYSLQVVPVAIYAWLRHSGDFRKALINAMNCGGDTDTVGAIAGGMLGASVGEEGIPAEWRDDIWEWPRSVAVMKRIADRLARQQVSQTVVGPTIYFWPGLIARNVLFLIIVLTHGFGRLIRPR